MVHRNLDIWYIGQRALEVLATRGEEFVLIEKVYLRTPNGFGRSKLVARLHRFIGAETTARNYRSVMAIRALV